MNELNQINQIDKTLRPRLIHSFKILYEFAEEVRTGNKLFELRKNDRGYQVGDLIRFNVVGHYTPQMVDFERHLYVITSVINYPDALKDGYVALGIKLFGDQSV